MAVQLTCKTGHMGRLVWFGHADTKHTSPKRCAHGWSSTWKMRLDCAPRAVRLLVDVAGDAYRRAAIQKGAANVRSVAWTFLPFVERKCHKGLLDKIFVQNADALIPDMRGMYAPRPWGDYISIAGGGNERHQKRSQQEINMSLDITSHPGRINVSLDNISHSGGPGHDELVPSRYALRVGEIDVMVVSDGVLSLPSAMLGHNADPEVRAAWLDNMFLPPDVLEWALNAVVVRSSGRTILIDAGIGVDPGLDLPRAGRLVQRLDAAGIDLASVTDVVLTHMHMDHIGGLLVDGVKDRLRPDLRVHLATAEAEFWASPDFSRVSMPPGFPDALRRTAKRFLNEYRSQMRTFETEYEVAPGVLVHRTGGHTPGHSVVRLASGGDRLTFAGDAVFQVGFEHPDWYNGFEHDPEEAARVRVRLLRELAATGEPLVATHLSFPSVCHVAVAGDVFRWVPAFWDY